MRQQWCPGRFLANQKRPGNERDYRDGKPGEGSIKFIHTVVEFAVLQTSEMT